METNLNIMAMGATIGAKYAVERMSRYDINILIMAHIKVHLQRPKSFVATGNKPIN